MSNPNNQTPQINETKLAEWMTVYEAKLIEAINNYPAEYRFSASMAPTVAGKMRAAIINQSYSKDGRAIKATCKHFGIPHTYTAINSFLQSV
jgi:hypothetical protein